GQIAHALLIGRRVVADNPTPRAAGRAPLIELARRYEARVVGYFFEPGIQDSLRRNAAREPQVPKVAIFTTAKKLQPPSFEEGFDEIHDVRLAEGGGFSVAQRA